MIQKDISLKQYTTFKIGGKAKYFSAVSSNDELISAVRWAKENKLPFFVLGGGSNLLISDDGFKGLVIKIESSKLETREGEKGSIKVEAGVELEELVKFCQKNNLSGMEWASGIPRVTLGGSIYMNAGAFGQKIADIIEEVEVFNQESGKIETLQFDQCEFGYKESIFKKNQNLIILSAVLLLEHAEPEDINREVERILEYRKSNHPSNPSAGSIFKNPRAQSAGQLIEKCGLAGQQIGDAQISKQHANFIINLGQAKAKDVKELINLIKQKVKEKFNIILEEEIQYLGF